jgi:hypothetical protein
LNTGISSSEQTVATGGKAHLYANRLNKIIKLGQIKKQENKKKHTYMVYTETFRSNYKRRGETNQIFNQFEEI